jgi:plastocyanin
MAPGAPSTTTSSASTSVGKAASILVAPAPSTVLVSPGETQTYASIMLRSAGSGPTGTISLKAFTPSGLSVDLNQSAVTLAGASVQVPFVLHASDGLPIGNYSVTVETSSTFLRPQNTTFTVGVVSELVVELDAAFNPSNLTVDRGTRVTWINLDGMIGCCDPGNHDVSFTSGANVTSPIMQRYATWSYQFGADGTYDYFCTIHPWMVGHVLVTG